MTIGMPDIWSAVWLSLQVAIWCTVLGLPIALAAGWVLARGHFRGKSLLSTVLLAPVVLPPVVTGFLLLRVFGANSLLGQGLAALGLAVPFSLAGAVLAALVVGLPFFIMGARSAFEAVDRRLEELSLVAGHDRRATFLQVTLPLAAPGIGAGAVLAFARSLGEFGATAVLAGNMEGETRTIALAVYTLLEFPEGEAHIYSLVWISLGLSFAALLGYEALNRWQRQRLL